MSEMGLHYPFEHLKHKLWPKEGPRVKSSIWLPHFKVENQPDFLTCKWYAAYCWKTLDEGYNFASNLIAIKGLHAKLWAHKVVGVPGVRILGLSLESPRTKCHLDVGLMERHIIYYKGEGGGFPQIRAVVSLVSSNLPMALPSIKSAQIMH
jgi:hypothetical protein